MNNLIKKCFVQSSDSKRQRELDESMFHAFHAMRLRGGGKGGSARMIDNGDGTALQQEEEKDQQYDDSDHDQLSDQENNNNASNKHNKNIKKPKLQRVIIDDVRYADSCYYCKFRNWAKNDVAFVFKARKKQRQTSDEDGGEAVHRHVNKGSYYWCCPDCALSQRFIQKSEYHANTNLLRPIPDSIDPFYMVHMGYPSKDLSWTPKQRKRVNWISQYQHDVSKVDGITDNRNLACTYPQSSVADCFYYATMQDGQTVKGINTDDDDEYMYACYYSSPLEDYL